MTATPQGMGPAVSPRRGFLGWPLCPDPRDWPERLAAAVIGLPASPPYPGEARLNDQARGPGAIRDQSHQISDGPDHHDFDLGAPLTRLLGDAAAIDAGDCPVSRDPAADFEADVARLEALFSRARFVAVLGGDHGVTIPVLHALDRLNRQVHLVQIDAHLDWRDEVGGERQGYSSPIRRASELGAITGITQIGLRGTGSARAGEHAAALAHGAHLFPAAGIHARGMGPVIEHLRGRGPFYLTIDADGLDPSVMPGVCAPVPGGLRFEQVAQLIAGLAGPDGTGLVGMDIVELAPGFDLPNAISAITAGRLVLNALGAALRA